MQKIIIIEDEKSIALSLKIILEKENFFVSTFDKGLDGFSKYKGFDLMILDLMLPDIDGLEILKKIREDSSSFPVLIVSAKADEDDLVMGLELGADDYITKPFSIKELILRIKRSLTRKDLFVKVFKDDLDFETVFKFGNKNVVDFANLVAQTINGEIKLTTQEANMLYHLIKNKNKLISRQDLLEKIWGYNRDIETRTIDNFVVRFRKYFETNPKKPVHFITKRGVGYQFISP